MAKQREVKAKTPEAEENYLISLAVKETEKRLKNGTASSQLIALLLKHATTRAQLELEKLRSDIALQKAKEQEIADKASNSDLYAQALKAFKEYKGERIDDEEYDDEDDCL